jgi:hypothetical protein
MSNTRRIEQLVKRKSIKKKGSTKKKKRSTKKRKGGGRIGNRNMFLNTPRESFYIPDTKKIEAVIDNTDSAMEQENEDRLDLLRNKKAEPNILLKNEFGSEKMKGKNSLLCWSVEENAAYEKKFKNTSTIVLTIRGHGYVSNTPLQKKNVYWYSSRPFIGPLTSNDDINSDITKQLHLIYRWANDDINNKNFNPDIDRIKSGKIINHYKVLQKFMLNRLYENVTINDAIMDHYSQRPTTRHLITLNKFNELRYDKTINIDESGRDHRGVYISYTAPPHRNILNGNKLLIEKDGEAVVRFKLSTLIDKLQGKEPFIIKKDNSFEEVFVHFDNIFIYDFSCNSSKKIHDTLCYNNLMKGDVINV